MTLSNLLLTAKFEFVIISRHLVIKKGSQKRSVLKEIVTNFAFILVLKDHLFLACRLKQARSRYGFCWGQVEEDICPILSIEPLYCQDHPNHLTT